MIRMVAKIKEAWTGPGRKDGTITAFKPEYDALHIDINKRGSAEWWYFDARLENGYFVVGFFRARHERTGKTGVEITIYSPSGEKIQKIFNYSRSEATFSREKPEVQIGNNFIKSDGFDSDFPTYEVYLDEGELGFHLKFSARVQSWMPGRGYTEFGELGHFGWCIALPKADVEGTIKVENKTISVKGIGYHDHNWLNFNMARVVKYWHWGRFYSDTFTGIFASITCNKKLENHSINVLMLAKDEKIFLSTGEFDFIEENFKYSEKAGNLYPELQTIRLSESDLIRLHIQEVMDADNLLFEFGALVRFIAKRILRLKPGYFRFKSQFTLKLNYEGYTFKEMGITYHEMVIVKP